MSLPVLIVGMRKVGAKMNSARFLSLQRSFDDEPGNSEHVLQFPSAGRCEGPPSDVLSPSIDVLSGILQRLSVPSDPDMARHQTGE